jgi:DNA-binding GntR family transcriptional regulator
VDGPIADLPLARTRATARLQSTELLRELILNGTLGAGVRLNEVELAAKFGMSRGPIRESLQTLAAEGLVTIRSHRGTFVKAFTRSELDDLYEVRLVIEANATRLAAVRRTDDQVGALRELLEATQRRLAEDGVYPNDHDFHLQVLAMAHNDVLTTLGRNLLAQMALARSRSAGSSAERRVCALQEHWAVYEALAEGNDAKAETLMRYHLHKSYENVVRTLDGTVDPAVDPAIEAGADGDVATSGSEA